MNQPIGDLVKDLIELVAKHLVDNEAAVSVKEMRTERMAVYEITVADDDYGKLIGTGGAHVKALRILLSSVARKYGLNAALEVNDPKHRKVKT